MRILLASMVAMAAAFQPLAPRSSSLTRPAAFGKPKPSAPPKGKSKEEVRALSSSRVASRRVARAAGPRASLVPRRLRRPAQMSAWEIYTDGEYGQAFKFPWEVEASDKTAPTPASESKLPRRNAAHSRRPSATSCPSP